MKLSFKTSIALVGLCYSSFAFAGEGGWSSDFAASKKEATESKKDLLMDFTGSDWCGWCIKLKKEVFDCEPFKVGVKDKFVLLEVDFPQDKKKLTEETTKQNADLAKKYPVSGYPAILLCDAAGKPYATTGYQEGGPEEYVKHLDTLQTRKTKRDDAFATAKKESGVAKAKALVEALEAMDLEDEMITNFYGDTLADIKAADPKDESGFIKKKEVKAMFAKSMDEINELAGKQEWANAVTVVEKAVKSGGFGKDETQQLMIVRGRLLNEMSKFDDAIKAMEEAAAIMPDSERKGDIADFITEFQEAKTKAETK
jgi:thioredoxin-related protein